MSNAVAARIVNFYLCPSPLSSLSPPHPPPFIPFSFFGSIMGALRTWPEFLYTLFNHGFYHSVCIPSFYDGVTGFWAYMFVIRFVSVHELDSPTVPL